MFCLFLASVRRFSLLYKAAVRGRAFVNSTALTTIVSPALTATKAQSYNPELDTNMALAPQFQATLFGSRTARNVLEIYIDFVCPFSAKQVKGVREHLVPLIEGQLKNDLAVILRCTPQPWHASSTFTHEVFLAIVKADPSKAWPFAYALMEKQVDFFDMNVAEETPNATRARLAKLAKDSVGVDEKKVLGYISLLGTSPNSGTKVTDDLKLQVKLGRQNGIHVTPTCVLNGLVDSAISSSYGAAEWKKWLDEKIKQK